MFERDDTSRILTDAELSGLLAAAATRRHKNAPRDCALLLLLATTGMRPSEALELQGRDLHLAAGGPWLMVRRRKPGRAGPSRCAMLIPAELAAVLRRHARGLRADARLFPMHKRQARRIYHYYARLAGIQGRTWIYCLRHTAATRIYRATKDRRLVQQILGHVHTKMSTLYAHAAHAALREWAQRQPVTS